MKLFDNVEYHKTRICGTWHFGKELSILNPWYWITSWCNGPWSYDQTRKSSIPAGSRKSIDFPSSSSPWRFNKNKLLMRNHQSCPTRFESFPEVNAISSQTRGCGWERDCGRERNPRYHGSYNNNSQKMKTSLHHQKWNNTKWNNTEAKQENGSDR